MIERRLIARQSLWSFNPIARILYLSNKSGNITLDKVELFSLMRFMIRCSQNMSVHRKHDRISKANKKEEAKEEKEQASQAKLFEKTM